jgi:hypothetical protein
MKLSISLISRILALLTPALGCVQASGYIFINDFGGIGIAADLYDNGAHLCSTDLYNGWYIDNDHYSINCAPGYYYAFTQNGETGYYGYSGLDFSWGQPTDTWADDCNPDMGEWCYTIEWSLDEYC